MHPIAPEVVVLLKIWRFSPGVVLERIIIDTGGLRPSYLGPPQSGQSTH